MATKKTTTTKTTTKVEIPERIEGDVDFYDLRLDKEQVEFVNAILDKETDIIFVNAKAGTGKTTCSIGASNILVQGGAYEKIIYIMSPYNASRQGLLPGTQTEKSSVYFEQLYQAMITCGINPYTAMNDESLVNQKKGTGFITAITDTYVRGSNFENSIIIIDEAQNFTKDQLKTVLTRIKDNCKTIVIGHTGQIDLVKKSESGFINYLEFAEKTIEEENEDKPSIKICELTQNHRGKVSRWADSIK